jgi:hypothetical protein
MEARLDAMDKAVLILQAAVNRSPTVGELVARVDEKFHAIEESITDVVDKLAVAEKAMNAKFAESELSRADALNKAAQSIQIGLDKADRQVQLSLDRMSLEFRGTLTKAEERLQQDFAERDKIINEKVEHLRSLHDEKFDSIATQFRERDTRTEQTSKDSKVAVDAALQAAKEAVGEQNKSNALSISKSEAAFTKQIDQIGTLITTTAKNVDDKIDDLKARIGAIEARGSAYSQGFGFIATGIGIVAAIVGAVIAIFFKSGGTQ